MATFCSQKSKVMVTAVLLTAGGSAIAANSPLPGFAQKTRPVVFFLLDTSGSMLACDGGEVLPSRDLTPKPGGGYFFDPLVDTADNGNCPSNRPANGPYPTTRLEAMKLSIARILDADQNGVIDDGDEELLRLETGVTNYPDFSDTNYNVGPGRPVGSSYAEVWDYVRGLRGSGGTPTGPALAGARARFLQRCYDGNAGTACALDQNLSNGNDKGAACRDYYVVLLTDGVPNTDSSGGVGFDPLPVARALVNKQKVLASEATPAVLVRTFAIGLGADVTGIGTNPRGYINCSSYWGSRNGSRITDANKDGDANADTMKASASANATAVGTACNADENMNAAVKGLGHGYFAKDARELSDTFRTIMNAIQAGTYSRSQPTTSGTGALAAGEYVLGAFFDVEPDALDWRGHLRKYRYNSELGEYVDCDSPTSASNPVEPCWDAGGWYGKTNLSSFGYKGLYERPWRSRQVFAVNPANVAWDPDLGRAFVTRPTTSSEPTVLDMVSRLQADYAAAIPATSGMPLYSWAAFSLLKDASSTYSAADVLPAARLKDAAQTLAFTVGRPTSTFASGTKRCSGPTCDDASGSPKLGDSYNSRPAIVGPPSSPVTSSDYLGEFRDRVLDTYTGQDRVMTATGGPADPCDGRRNRDAKCTVEVRRSVVFLAANDGMIHAFDEKNGDELWAFLPPGHMTRLAKSREGRTPFIDGLLTIRDVRFPCDREASGACKAVQSRPLADGKWHTVLVVNQGTGGNFLFALDITNPVKPVFLWEFRKPDKMGLTVARPVIAEISRTLPTLADPGSALFVPGGYFPTAAPASDDPTDTSVHPHFFSLRVFDGEIMKDRHIDPRDLAGDRTLPGNTINAMTGAPTAIDGDIDGVTDRVYFGDREGRMWKAYGLAPNGDFSLKLFFDPALYDVSRAGEVGRPADPLDPTGGESTPQDRQRLRGPIFFAPDVTRDVEGNLLVAFGSGNMLDPLSEPGTYGNFLWVVQDSAKRAGDAGALKSRCGTGANLQYTAAGGTTFTAVLPMSDLLTGAPYIYKNLLFYPEFDPDRDGDGDVCEDDYLSRVIAVDTFNCGTPGFLPFEDANGQPTNVKEFPNAIVTSVQIDPRTGSLFTQVSSSGATPPQAEAIPGLAEQSHRLGFRQPY